MDRAHTYLLGFGDRLVKGFITILLFEAEDDAVAADDVVAAANAAAAAADVVATGCGCCCCAVVVDVAGAVAKKLSVMDISQLELLEKLSLLS